ncbi:MAG TPA: GNAT family N-acetyltransferase [Ktedonobacterales bacterium]|nr:GNAT family N-acetyltransferase [Ktedonobacterales bacterium]
MTSGSIVTSTAALADPSYRRALDDELVLRWSTEKDVEGLARLCADAFRDEESDPPNSYFANWVHDLMSGKHPLAGPGDFALVEDTRTGEIVAGAVLMRQTWSYAGIEAAVGRPEAVATKLGYRNRGLIRAIFELLHARSDARGDLVSAITGIYYYYRQFGYEYALDLSGSWRIALDMISRLADGATEPYTLRPATLDALPRVMEFYNHDCARALVSTTIDEQTWRWIISGMDPLTDENWNTYLILNGERQAIGYVMTARARYGDMYTIRGLHVEPVIPLTAVLPSVLRALAALVPSVPAPHPRTRTTTQLSLGLGREHPAYDALPHSLPVAKSRPYAWYVRVADLPRLITHIARALEERLPGTAVAGYTGEVKLSFYRGGLRLAFVDGQLTTAEDWAPTAWDAGQAGFPPLVFLRLLFGYQSLEQLQTANPDVWVNDSIRPLMEALFRARLSWVVPLD